MPYCPICEKCLCSIGRKGTVTDRKYTLGANLRKHKAGKFCGSGRIRKPNEPPNNNPNNTNANAVISTKCGHLFHQTCLQDYITNFRTKGDCYGTTYNVLCPICGSNLSNGKTLKIDIEAHFGVLDEFFQDLCKLKYMNKELKHTLEIEWVDIGDLEKKIESSKREYTHVKNVKRENEQRCAALEERISKAIDNAGTCYRYREIEKQLLDENINLEAVARRMETIINSRLRSKLTSASSAASLHPESPDERGRSAIGCCGDEPQAPYHRLINAAMNSAIVSTESGADESVMSKLKGRSQVDINVQISVHSEWSVNSAQGASSEAVEVLKRKTRDEILQMYSSSSGTSNEINGPNGNGGAEIKCRGDEGDRAKLPPKPGPHSNRDNRKEVEKAYFISPSHNNLGLRKADEWCPGDHGVPEHCSMVQDPNIQPAIKEYEELVRKVSDPQAEASTVDKSRSYTIRSYPQNGDNINVRGRAIRNLPDQQIGTLAGSGRRGCEDLNCADKSRSFTIQVHKSTDNISSPREAPPKVESSDHLLKALLRRGEEEELNEQNQEHELRVGTSVVSHRPPIIPVPRKDRGKAIITPPQMFVSHQLPPGNKGFIMDIPLPPPPMDPNNRFFPEKHMTMMFSTKKLPPESHGVSLYPFELVLPPPPDFDPFFTQDLALVVPPPPPMTARAPRVETPRSTQRLINALLRSTAATNSSMTPIVRSKLAEDSVVLLHQSRNAQQHVSTMGMMSGLGEDHKSTHDDCFLSEGPGERKLCDISDSEDELLKAVISNAAASSAVVPAVPVILDRGEVETGAGDIQQQCDPIHASCCYDDRNNNHNGRSSNNMGGEPPGTYKISETEHERNLSRGSHCVAAERFVREASFHNMFQNAKVGVEPAEESSQHHNNSSNNINPSSCVNLHRLRPGVHNRQEAGCFNHSGNNSSNHSRNCFITPYHTVSSTTHQNNHFTSHNPDHLDLEDIDYHWSTQNVSTPVVIERGGDHPCLPTTTNSNNFPSNARRNSYITPETSYTILHNGSIISPNHSYPHCYNHNPHHHHPHRNRRSLNNSIGTRWLTYPTTSSTTTTTHKYCSNYRHPGPNHP